MRRLDLVVGPNGAGKSTFIRLTLLSALPPDIAFVNADEIARQRWPGDQEAHAYDAALIAADTRVALIRAGQPFVAETVFSHPSKLELIDEAHAAGYLVFLHVLLVPESLSVSRVEHRVRAGGHSVPEQKIRERYARLWSLVADAMTRAESTTAYDNSRIEGPKIIAQLASGVAYGSVVWPTWAPQPLPAMWPNT